MLSMPEILARARNLSAIGYINKSASSEALSSVLRNNIAQVKQGRTSGDTRNVWAGLLLPTTQAWLVWCRSKLRFGLDSIVKEGV